MKLVEAMGGVKMPCGEGKCNSNWGFLFPIVFARGVKKLELDTNEFVAFVEYFMGKIDFKEEFSCEKGIKLWGVEVTLDNKFLEKSIV